MRALGLYIHFPFCIRKCHYCDFCSIPLKPSLISPWLSALVHEMEQYTHDYADHSVKTVYIGGGSPNLLSEDYFNILVKSMYQNFQLAELSEFTIELNPADISKKYLMNLKSSGVNRISLGGQSFHDQELQTLGRIHRVADIFRTVENIHNIDFEHLNVDLIFGVPGQTMNSWQESLEKALGTGADHLSLYNLSYEKSTALFDFVKSGKIQIMEPSLEEELYLAADRLLTRNGFQHYEISNWAKPACSSQHNQNYWNGGKYLGLGPAAHSFNGESRWWNVRSVNQYTGKIKNGKLPVSGHEKLSEYDCEVEFLLLKLRTGEGLLVSQFGNVFHLDFQPVIERLNQAGIDEEFWQFDQQRFKLTPKGWFVSDMIIGKILGFIEEIKNDRKKRNVSASRVNC